MILEGCSIIGSSVHVRLPDNGHMGEPRDGAGADGSSQGGSDLSHVACRGTSVVIVTPSLTEIKSTRNVPAGIQEIDLNVALLLSEKVHVTILSPYYPPYKKETRVGSVRICYVRYPSMSGRFGNRLEILASAATGLVFAFLAMIRAVGLTRYRGTTVVFSDKSSGLLAAFAARLMGRRTVFSEGNPYPWYIPPGFAPTPGSRLWNVTTGLLACKVSNSVRAQSEAIRTGMISLGVPPKKIQVISAGVDTTEFDPGIKSVEGHPGIVVGYFGRIAPEKGSGLLLEILRRAPELDVQAKFLIVGDGFPSGGLAGMSNVELQGTARRSVLPQIMSSCDFFLAPHPDLSLTILQEMALGKPVIALNSRDVRAAIHNMVNGVLVEGNPDSFCKSIELLSGDGDLRARIGHNARQSILERFSWAVIRDQWISLVLSKEEGCIGQ
ncbi:MAG: glycosyltransferase family 4 protein [Nitrososphaerota archaeon]|nr:glycosyltransferase family 4 protein [Nitrososphaerota archaeon]